MSYPLQRAEAPFVIGALRSAGLLARAVQNELAAHALTKEDRSPVTVADFAVQALVARALIAACPDTPLVAEEDAEALREPAQRTVLDQIVSFVRRWAPEADAERVCAWIDHGNGEPAGRYWVLDPIDGTKGFLRGEQYAIALALVEDGRVVLGGLACPNLTDARRPEPGGPGTLVIAARGEGTWAAPLEGDGFKRLQVSTQTDVAAARTVRSVESGHTNVTRLDRVLMHLGAKAEPVRMDSQAKYAVLAAGEGELLFRLLSSRQPDYRECIWDQAAGSLVLEEAGGRITDLHGKPLDFTAGKRLFHNEGVLATSGPMHDAALAALAAVD